MTDNSERTFDSAAVRDLSLVLASLERTIGGVTAEQRDLPTPCTDFDVRQLIDHILGWSTSYAARLSGRESREDPSSFRAGPEPREEFHRSAKEIVAGYRRGGEAADQLPIEIVLMDLEVHGWDLATATGQAVAYGDEAAERALTAGRHLLKSVQRGPGKAFSAEVEPPADATPLQALVALLGRDPAWGSASAELDQAVR